jgi:hypothetical protein
VTHILSTDLNKEEMCQCRKCNHIFHQSEINRVHTGYGVDLKCPNPTCGSTKFGLINYPVDESKLLHNKINYNKSKKHTSKDKEIFYRDFYTYMEENED